MRVFILLIPIAGIYLVLSSLFKFKKLINPVSIISFWWTFWLWLSNFSLTGLFVPSSRTQIMVLVMLLAVSIGSLLAYARDRDPAATSLANQRFVQNRRRLLWLNLLFTPIMGFLLYRALPTLLTSNPASYRMDVYGTVDRPSPVFGGGYNQFLFFLIVSPIVFFSFVVGAVDFFKFKKKGLLLISFLLMAVESVFTLGRFNFYYMLAIPAFAYVFVSQRKAHAAGDGAGEEAAPAKVRLKPVNFALGAAAVLAVLLAFSLFRGERYLGPVATLEKIAIDYHTVGLVLFDQELVVPSSRMNSGLSYGRSIIGGLDTLAVIPLRRFNPSLVPIAGENGIYMQERHQVGRDGRGEPIFANAFYTILYSMYFDGRYLAIVLFSLVFGYFLSSSYQNWRKNGGLASLIGLILLMYVGVFSIFQSPVEGMKFWVALLLILWLKKFSLAFVRQSRPGDHA
jgi:oligosaccharide repeat unit polymerase